MISMISKTSPNKPAWRKGDRSNFQCKGNNENLRVLVWTWSWREWSRCELPRLTLGTPQSSWHTATTSCWLHLLAPTLWAHPPTPTLPAQNQPVGTVLLLPPSTCKNLSWHLLLSYLFSFPARNPHINCLPILYWMFKSPWGGLWFSMQNSLRPSQLVTGLLEGTSPPLSGPRLLNSHKHGNVDQNC